jgi:hypothetical protein
LPKNLLSGNLNVNGLLYTFLGTVLPAASRMGGLLFHFARHMGMPVPFRFWPCLFTEGKSVNSYSVPTFRPTGVTPKRTLTADVGVVLIVPVISRQASLYSLLRFTLLVLYDPRPPHYSSTGNCLTIMVYIQHNTFRTNNINFNNSAINATNVY